MIEPLTLHEDSGLFTAVLPVFGNQVWPIIVPQSGFVWIDSPFVDLSGMLEPIVGKVMFGTRDLDLKCYIHRVDLDISIPATDFLGFANEKFNHGLDFIHSEKHQPMGLRLGSVSKPNWPRVMKDNDITLAFHRPGIGEPSLVTSWNRETVNSILLQFLEIEKSDS